MERVSETQDSSQQSAAWTDKIWIQDQWTEEDKSEARDRLDAVASLQQQQDRHLRQTRAFHEFRRNASTNWNVFYEQNKTNFFKDRHYLHKAFPEEFGWLYAHSENSTDADGDDIVDATSHAVRDGSDADTDDKNDIRIVEIGCGVGNAILPLMEQHSDLMKQYNNDSVTDSTCNNTSASRPPPQLHIHCLDFAPKAIQLLKDDYRFQSAAKEGRGTAHVYDLSSTHPSTIFIGNSDGTQQVQHQTSNQTPQVLANSADVAILLFCLSAVGPHPSPSLDRAARHVIDMLKPGGTLVMRDYGRLDEAQMKLGKSDKELGRNFYRKGDGTGCYYFELDDLKALFVNRDANDNKLELLELDYIQRVYRNRGDGTTRRRVWVQGRFRKPLNAVPCGDEKCAAANSLDASADALKQFLGTVVERWDDHYKALSPMSSSSSPPSNLLQIFPNEFQSWQTSKKKGRRHQPPQSSSHSQTTLSEVTVIDIGCGLGNDTLLNLVEKQQLHHEEEHHKHQEQECPPSSSSTSHGLSKPPILNVHFLDASNEAIQKLRSDPRYQCAIAVNEESIKEPKFTVATVASQVCNVAAEKISTAHLEQSANIILLLFTLSAIGPYQLRHQHPNQFRHPGIIKAAQNAASMLEPGGIILFRDYARYDDDQLQLNSIAGAQLCDNFYERRLDAKDQSENNSTTNGTGCYFFDLEEVRQLFTNNTGLEVLQLEYISRIYKKSGKNGRDCSKNGGATEQRRLWVHGKFRKPNI